MKRFLGLSLAMFFALIAFALFGGDNGAVAGHGCHGGRRCHGGMMARKHERREERCHGRHGKHRGCHGEVAVAEDCGGCGEVASDCGGCGETVSSGCAGGDCGGEGVIVSEGVPTEAAPVEAPAAPAAPEST